MQRNLEYFPSIFDRLANSLAGIRPRDRASGASCKLGRCMMDIFQESKDSGLKLLILTTLHLIRFPTDIPRHRGRGENNPASLRNR